MKLILVFAFVFSVSQHAASEIYKCTSEKGKVGFQSTPCTSGTSDKVTLKQNSKRSKLPGCNHDLVGQWLQTHISMKLDEGLMEDASQKWRLSSDYKAVHEGFIKQDFTYSCEGDVITFNAMVKNQLRVVRSDENSMVWESIDFGGFIYVSR